VQYKGSHKQTLANGYLLIACGRVSDIQYSQTQHYRKKSGIEDQLRTKA